jgi:hypothetical protein
MYPHPYFNLWLHDETELAEALGSAITARTTLHEWPLSCVQCLTLASGRKLIYKSQYGPTSEAAFYAAARSPLLITANTLSQFDYHTIMMFEYLDAPLLKDLNLVEAEAVQIGHELLMQINAIEGNIPYLVDISTQDAWAKVIGSMVADLHALVAEGKFSRISLEDIQFVAEWVSKDTVLAAIRSGSGTVHGDFAGDNIFRVSDGYRVIDWQRIVCGPPQIAFALFLESLGFDPLRHVPPDIVAMMLLMRMWHLIGCARMWFPAGILTYDMQIVSHITRLRGLMEIIRRD